jgi:hypothetical protein
LPSRLAIAPIAATLAGLVFASSARGEAELYLGLATSGNYDNNVGSQPVQTQDDFYLQVGPTLRAVDRTGKLTWSAQYLPSYSKYARFSSLDNWQQIATGNISWRPSERARAWVSTSYADVSSIAELSQQEIAPDVGTELTRQGVKRTAVSGGLELRPGRRHSFTLSLDDYTNNYDESFRSDVSTLGGGISYLYDLTRLDRTGVGFRYTGQTFSGIGNAADSTTRYYNASLQWLHVFDRTLSFSVRAGPALVEPPPVRTDFVAMDQARFPRIVGAGGRVGQVQVSTCPTLDDGTPILAAGCQAFPLDLSFFFPALTELTDLTVIGDVPSAAGSTLTYFASLSLAKEWRTVRLDLQYSRDTSTSGNFGGSAVRDYVLGQLVWRITPRFRTDFQASWQSFESAGKSIVYARALQPVTVSSPLISIGDVGEAIGFRAVAVDQKRQNVIYTARLRFGYRFNRRTRGSLSVLWQRQQIGDPITTIDIDRLIVTLGVTYEFGPIRLGI